jgi:spore coat protein U-like protein
MRHALMALCCVVMCQLAVTSTAAAQSCSATVAVDFGTIDLTLGGPVAISGTVDVNCTGTANQTVRACPGIGSPRQMTRTGGGLITYDLYTDAGHATVWGSTAGSPSPPPLNVALNGAGSGTVSTTIYGLITAGQSGAATTTANPNYLQMPVVSVGSSTNTNLTCAEIGNSNAAAGSATIQASYPPTCTIIANPLAFGTLYSTLTAVDQSTSIETHCSAGSAYTMSLNGGLTGATDPAAREMQSGANRLRYGIYRDSNHSEPWGTGAAALTSSGSGTSQSIAVYGRVQPQPSPPSGSYTDTVMVTIDY